MTEYTYVLTSKAPAYPKVIAAHLRTLAQTLPEEAFGDRCEIVFGTFRIRCDHSRRAVTRVARKYDKGTYNMRRRSFTMPQAGRPIKRIFCSTDTVLGFIADGELDNLREYLALFDRKDWPIEAVKWDATQRAAS